MVPSPLPMFAPPRLLHLEDVTQRVPCAATDGRLPQRGAAGLHRAAGVPAEHEPGAQPAAGAALCSPAGLRRRTPRLRQLVR